MSIIYRQANPNDAPALLEYLAAVGAETDNLSYGAEGFKISRKREEKFIERFDKNENDLMLLALDENKIVANASIERNRIKRFSHRAELSITVLRNYWGQGIGSRLMEQLISFASLSGTALISLEVRADNGRAIALYRKFGFETVGTFKKYFKIGDSFHDAFIMQLLLPI